MTKKIAIASILVVLLVALAWMIGCTAPTGLASREADARHDAAGRAARAPRYHCPMHPTIVYDRPGECPICSMTLVPIVAENGAAEPDAGNPCVTVTDVIIVDGQETTAPKRMCKRPPSNRYVRA